MYECMHVRMYILVLSTWYEVLGTTKYLVPRGLLTDKMMILI